eukprot:XP_001710166.1 Hypothetical protein GL50803_102731 [Giardia lamblia ATCC 50803]
MAMVEEEGSPTRKVVVIGLGLMTLEDVKPPGVDAAVGDITVEDVGFCPVISARIVEANASVVCSGAEANGL